MIKRPYCRSHTLVELLIVVALFTFIFGATLSLLIYSERSWRTGTNKVIEQQEARKAADNIAFLLRQSSPKWIINGNEYPININSDGDQIIFYRPIFDNSGNITILKRVKFYRNPGNTTQLLKEEGNATPVTVAGYINSISFQAASLDNTRISISITTKVDLGYTLYFQVTLRNLSSILPPSVVVETPEIAGEI